MAEWQPWITMTFEVKYLSISNALGNLLLAIWMPHNALFEALNFKISWGRTPRPPLITLFRPAFLFPICKLHEQIIIQDGYAPKKFRFSSRKTEWKTINYKYPIMTFKFPCQHHYNIKLKCHVYRMWSAPATALRVFSSIFKKLGRFA